MSDTVGPAGRPAGARGAKISPADLELPVTQPIDISYLMHVSDESADPTATSAEGLGTPPADSEPVDGGLS